MSGNSSLGQGSGIGVRIDSMYIQLRPRVQHRCGNLRRYCVRSRRLEQCSSNDSLQFQVTLG
jgi:hypothetical protein